LLCLLFIAKDIAHELEVILDSFDFLLKNDGFGLLSEGSLEMFFKVLSFKCFGASYFDWMPFFHAYYNYILKEVIEGKSCA
jgi:hypothetical protein